MCCLSDLVAVAGTVHLSGFKHDRFADDAPFFFRRVQAVLTGRSLRYFCDAAGAAASYEARSSNSISGLTDVSQLSNPMAVRYDEVMAATEERVRMRKEKIDPTSPLGEILESAAHRRVSAASRIVMRQNGHCSAWKKIRRKDGRTVPDKTADVIAELASVTPDPE